MSHASFADAVSFPEFCCSFARPFLTSAPEPADAEPLPADEPQDVGDPTPEPPPARAVSLPAWRLDALNADLREAREHAALILLAADGFSHDAHDVDARDVINAIARAAGSVVSLLRDVEMPTRPDQDEPEASEPPADDTNTDPSRLSDAALSARIALSLGDTRQRMAFLSSWQARILAVFGVKVYRS